jgi:hypothetical protein
VNVKKDVASTSICVTALNRLPRRMSRFQIGVRVCDSVFSFEPVPRGFRFNFPFEWTSELCFNDLAALESGHDLDLPLSG